MEKTTSAKVIQDHVRKTKQDRAIQLRINDNGQPKYKNYKVLCFYAIKIVINHCLMLMLLN